MRAPGRDDPLTDDEDEYHRVYYPGPPAARAPEAWVDLDARPQIPFGFQRSRRQRVPANPSRQARALGRQRGIR